MSNPLVGFSASRNPKMPLAQKLWAVAFAVFIAAVAYPFVSHWLTRSGTPAGLGALNTAAEVQAKLIGVWTFAKPTNLDRIPYGWERWTFTPSGLQIQSAKPSDVTWGDARQYSYEINRRKTADTGQWYWHVRAKDTVMNAAVMGDGALVAFWSGTDSGYRLLKEDKDLSK